MLAKSAFLAFALSPLRSVPTASVPSPLLAFGSLPLVLLPFRSVSFSNVAVLCTRDHGASPAARWVARWATEEISFAEAFLLGGVLPAASREMVDVALLDGFFLVAGLTTPLATGEVAWRAAFLSVGRLAVPLAKEEVPFGEAFLLTVGLWTLSAKEGLFWRILLTAMEGRGAKHGQARGGKPSVHAYTQPSRSHSARAERPAVPATILQSTSLPAFSLSG